jgi:membrane protease YdiL (CAAX protease family)
MARARLRWGLPDVLLAWLAGFLCAIVFSVFAAGIDPDLVDKIDADEIPTWYLVGALIAQSGATVLALLFISDRKGQRSLARDFGLVPPWRTLHARGVGAWLAVGVGVQLLAAVVLVPINQIADLDESAQDVGRTVERAGGVGLVLLVLGVVVLAPVVEELLFRGALLRALQRKWSAPVAVFVSAALFAGIHVVGDPGSYPYLPAWAILGLVSGYQAVRTGDLARSVLLHMGFNLVGAVTLILL